MSLGTVFMLVMFSFGMSGCTCYRLEDDRSRLSFAVLLYYLILSANCAIIIRFYCFIKLARVSRDVSTRTDAKKLFTWKHNTARINIQKFISICFRYISPTETSGGYYMIYMQLLLLSLKDRCSHPFLDKTKMLG